MFSAILALEAVAGQANRTRRHGRIRLSIGQAGRGTL